MRIYAELCFLAFSKGDEAIHPWHIDPSINDDDGHTKTSGCVPVCDFHRWLCFLGCVQCPTLIPYWKERQRAHTNLCRNLSIERKTRIVCCYYFLMNNSIGTRENK